MIRKIAIAALLGLAVYAPSQDAVAQNPLGGAILGGAAGAIVGGAVGGGRGVAVGAIVGATTGAAIAAQGQPRPGGYYYYQSGCYLQQPDGGWMAVSPRYCASAEYRTPSYGAPACTRFRSYDPATGTYVGRDGLVRPCP